MLPAYGSEEIAMIEFDFAIETLANARAFLQLGMRSQWMYRILLARLYYRNIQFEEVISELNNTAERMAI